MEHLFYMIQVDRNVYTLFNCLHECKSSPPHYLRSARTLVGKLAVIWKHCPDMWGLGWNLHLRYTNCNVLYVYTTGQNFSEVLPGTHGDGALSGRIKVLLSFFNPLIHVPALSPVFKDEDSHWLASGDIGFWNQSCGVCLHNCTENMVWFV